jgi:type IV pilus assembly protein PilP
MLVMRSVTEGSHNKKKKPNLWFKLAIIYSGLLLFGCEGSIGRSDLELFIENTKTMAKQNIDELPKEKESIVYNYVGLEKRSPFQSSEDFVRGQMRSLDGIDKPDIARKKEVLEDFDLNDLRMVGSLKSEEGTFWALIKDNNNMIYKVKNGNYLGRNFGKITKISSEGIEIDEIIADSLGSWKSNSILMKFEN